MTSEGRKSPARMRFESESNGGEFRPMSSVDLNVITAKSAYPDGLTRMSVLTTDFTDPVQRRAFMEMKKAVSKRNSVNFSEAAPERRLQTPSRGSTMSLSGSSSRTFSFNPISADKKRHVKFSSEARSSVKRCDSETPTSTKKFLERVKNTPSLLRTPIRHHWARLSPKSASSRTVCRAADCLDEADENCDVQSNEKVPITANNAPGDETQKSGPHEALNTLNTFLTQFRSLNVDQVEELTNLMDDQTKARLKSTLKMLQLC